MSISILGLQVSHRVRQLMVLISGQQLHTVIDGIGLSNHRCRMRFVDVRVYILIYNSCVAPMYLIDYLGTVRIMVVISAYHHQSCKFESRSWQDVLDATFCDKVCQ
jgi:hypothetical protein